MKTRLLHGGLALLALGILAASGQEPAADRDDRMAWWREARFGLFVHWGLYSGLAGTWEGKPVGTRGGMEWIQQRVGADTDTYARRAIPLFRPRADFAREWARLAREAGCRYVVFTTKHHDGFALHDSKVSEYDGGTVLGRDLVREIVEAVRAEGLRVGFYHSVIDWHHDQYAYGLSRQLPHPLKGKPYPNGERDHAKYLEYLRGQVTELVSNYGTVDVMWWDYSAQDFQGQEAWRAFDLMRMVRDRQPRIIMNNRLFRIPEAGWTGMGVDSVAPRIDPRYGDFLTPEQHIPATGMPGVDWETCMTMNTTWGYSAHDQAWKSDEVLIRNLIDIASKGGNYLLNIGPRGDGGVPEESVKALRAIGAWMRTNGESVYGAMASPFTNLVWGRCTQKPLPDGVTRLFLHVFDWPKDGQLKVPGLGNRVVGARLLASGETIPARRGAGGITLAVPAPAPDRIASVIALDIRGRPRMADAGRSMPDRATEPIALHPDNPHYFLWRGKPAVLVTSAEHYGAVLNLDFDYRKYLDTLAADGMNATRTFSGAYVEPAGAFKIVRNTLAPGLGRFICPWARSDQPGYAGGGNRFDLKRWDEAYFRRLKEFVGYAGRRGVVVELTLFCPMYADKQWELSPMNSSNNVNRVGAIGREDVYTLDRSGGLLEVQEALARKLVSELNPFDNVMFEICNEPYFGGVTMAWQHRIADVIEAAERALPRRHLITQNIANKHARIEKPHAAVSVFNFHYATPPDAVAMNYGLMKVIGDNETGFRGTNDAPYRIEAWEFILAGGGLFNHLDYSFVAGHEDGTFVYPATQPGGGNAAFRRQMRILSEFIHSFDFVRMRPDNSVVRGGAPAGGRVRALVEPGRAMAIYVCSEKSKGPAVLRIDLPEGGWQAEWIDTRTGAVAKRAAVKGGGERPLESPEFATDIALRLKKK